MDIFIARQPIYDKKDNVFAYELLYRGSEENFCNCQDLDKATISVLLNAFVDIGIDKITHGKKAFVKFTENLLFSNIFDFLPSNKVVIAISSDINPSRELLDRCLELRRMGFSLAFDNFVFKENLIDLLKITHYIKIDFSSTDIKYQGLLVNKLSSKNIKFIASKLETISDHSVSRDLGYSFFQGYYFSKPSIIKSKKIPMSTLTKIDLLGKISSEFLTLDELEDIIKKDVSLSYNILKIINSAKYALRSEIKTIKHAICMLGEAELKKWLYYLIIQSEATNCPPELFKLSIIRGKFSELIAKETDNKEISFDAFIMGVLSLMDRLFNVSLDTIIENLFVSEDVKSALFETSNNNLFKILNVVKAYENAHWEEVEQYAHELNIDPKYLGDAYLEALDWVDLA
ncbi:EAL and HDOD domain-containing protein [Oceanirhabdus seepicola]|uniref:HDOD domain-containing protein n=1 Tax=Oceanirhabdus seepicola TaxID=2828781 RepID=A0A9J6P0B1_9CLOT|nr:HDOD domain-containing protein [Oceanirhabdus seepicola]MCM1989796.1 HDOD domain-containing protein [Oceanirhabdus seepicola]